MALTNQQMRDIIQVAIVQLEGQYYRNEIDARVYRKAGQPEIADRAIALMKENQAVIDGYEKELAAIPQDDGEG